MKVNRKPGFTSSRGLTLIELMIALSIGLVVVLAAISAYLGTSGAARVSDAQSRMNEDAQAALAILSQQLRMAGNNPLRPRRIAETKRNPVYAPTTLIPTPIHYALRACDGRFSNLLTVNSIDQLACPAGPSPASDSIAVTYEADPLSTASNGAGSVTDCAGGGAVPVQSLPLTVLSDDLTSLETAVVEFRVVENRFFIGTSTSIATPHLYCKGNGSGPHQPLVENIEDLQLTYGVVSPASTNTSTPIAGYLTAHELSNAPSLAALTDEARWRKVVSVRVCIVVTSELPVAPSNESARYVRCDGELEMNPPDRRLRRAYSIVVALRNSS